MILCDTYQLLMRWIGQKSENFERKIVIISSSMSLNISFDTLKNRLMGTFLLSAHKKCFD